MHIYICAYIPMHIIRCRIECVYLSWFDACQFIDSHRRFLCKNKNDQKSGLN